MSSHKHCAFLTLKDRAGFYISDHLAIAALENLGWDVVEIPWNDDNVRWDQFAVVVIRSTWDYQQHPEQFLSVLAAIENSGASLYNPLKICRWNLDKSYLKDLSDRGITIVPTNWLSGLTRSNLIALFENLQCSQIVVKPTVSANADDTFALYRSEPDGWQKALNAFENRPVMAQPFIPSVIDRGEYSLFYFAGQFSHAISKKPKPGDFRVQEEHGGTIDAVEVDALLAGTGQRIMDCIPETLLYARVDLVLLPDGQPALMELELIEPSLYFECDPNAPGRFATALQQIASLGGPIRES